LCNYLQSNRTNTPGLSQIHALLTGYIDLIAILEKTGLSLTDGIAAACSIYGPSFNPLLALKAVTYTADLKPQLESTENQLLLDSVKDVNLGGLPSITPLGDIGVHPTSTDKAPEGRHRE